MKTTEPADQVLPKNIRYDEGGIRLYDDEAALKLVLDDTSNGDAWMNTQNWPAQWSTAYTIIQSPTAAFDGSGIQNCTANIPNYLVSNLVDAAVPKIMGGLFYESPPFLLRPRPGTSQDTVEAKTALFAYQLDDMDFEEECEATILQGALIGNMVMKFGWTEIKRQEKTYKRNAEPITIKTEGMTHTIHTKESDSFEVEYEEVEIHRPWIKYCDRRCVLVARGTRTPDIRKAKSVVYRDYATYDDLNNLRGYEGYDIPSESELQDFFMRERGMPDGDNISVALPESMRGWMQVALPRNFKDSADPLQDGLEILERWTKDTVTVVLRHMDDNILIRNEANPYKRIPFLSAVWRRLPDNFDGQGIGMLAGPNQIVSQGITNMSLSLLDYGLNPMGLRAEGFNPPVQDIVWSQGGILPVDVSNTGGDVRKAFAFLEMPQQPAAAMQWLMQQGSEAKESVGANQQMTLGAGAPGVQTTGTRSGTGAAGVIAANASRLDGPIGRFVRQIFVPWLRIMDELNNDRLPTSVLRDVLDKQMGKQIEMDHIQFRKAKMEYEVLAGAKLGPKKEMQQIFTFLVQLINNPTIVTLLNVAGYKIDIIAVVKDFAAAAGWKYNQPFFVPMTPQEQQKADAQLPSALAAQKSQNDQQSMVQQFQLETQKEDAKQLAKAGAEVARSTIEHGMATDPLAQPLGSEGSAL